MGHKKSTESLSGAEIEYQQGKRPGKPAKKPKRSKKDKEDRYAELIKMNLERRKKNNE